MKRQDLRIKQSPSDGSVSYHAQYANAVMGEAINRPWCDYNTHLLVLSESELHTEVSGRIPSLQQPGGVFEITGQCRYRSG